MHGSKTVLRTDFPSPFLSPSICLALLYVSRFHCGEGRAAKGGGIGGGGGVSSYVHCARREIKFYLCAPPLTLPPPPPGHKQSTKLQTWLRLCPFSCLIVSMDRICLRLDLLQHLSGNYSVLLLRQEKFPFLQLIKVRLLSSHQMKTTNEPFSLSHTM